MKLQAIYDHVIEMGIKNSPRSKAEIKERLKDMKDEYKKLDKKKQQFFDKERLTNPFLDSRILHGTGKEEVKRMLVGIDCDTNELLLAKELGRAGKKIDLVVAHHPEGRGLVDLGDVMDLQEEIISELGVSINVVEKLLSPRIEKIMRALSPINSYRSVEAAKLLDIPYMCTHTVADNQVYAFMKKFMDKKKPKYLKDVVDALLEIPEYQEAAKQGIGPTIFNGKPKSKVGKIGVTGMTGGTEGAEDIYAALERAGVGTVIDMHISEKHRENAVKHHINVVVAGHMASDSVGMNLLYDKIEKSGVEIVPCSGFTRVKR